MIPSGVILNHGNLIRRGVHYVHQKQKPQSAAGLSANTTKKSVALNRALLFQPSWINVRCGNDGDTCQKKQVRVHSHPGKWSPNKLVSRLL